MKSYGLKQYGKHEKPTATFNKFFLINNVFLICYHFNYDLWLRGFLNYSKLTALIIIT